jgi:hypothetical protein
MALDELHARRLATVVSLVEDAAERIEMTLQAVEAHGSKAPEASDLSPAQIRQIRHELESVRKHLAEVGARFSVRRQKPEPRQVLAAELSSLWVILENALPDRLKGYGREFAAQDRSDWDRQVRALLQDTERIRRIVLDRKSRR